MYFVFFFWLYLSNLFLSSFLAEMAQYESLYRRTAHHAASDIIVEVGTHYSLPISVKLVRNT